MRQRRDARHTPSPVHLLLCCASLTWLAGCHPTGPDTPFEIYLRKLGTALSVASPAHKTTDLPPLPSADDLKRAVSSGDEGRIDFLDLSGCAVQSTLIKQNSSLGRQAKPSQRLLLELEYLRLAPPCISRLRSEKNTALAETLGQAWRLGRQQLPALIFNATLGSDEYRAFWLTAPGAGAYPRVDPEVAVSALETINHHVRRWLKGNYQAQNRDFELLLSEVAGGDGGAQLQALSGQGDWLATADFMLEGQLASDPLCAARGRDSVSAGLLADAHQYFNAELHPRVVDMTRRNRELLSAIATLEAQLTPALPHHYRDWQEDRNQRFTRLERAPLRHLERLTRVGRSCARLLGNTVPKSLKIGYTETTTGTTCSSHEEKIDEHSIQDRLAHTPVVIVSWHPDDSLRQRPSQTDHRLQG